MVLRQNSVGGPFHDHKATTPSAVPVLRPSSGYAQGTSHLKTLAPTCGRRLVKLDGSLTPGDDGMTVTQQFG